MNNNIVKRREITIKIRKILNHCNCEDNDFRSTNERSLEARDLPLWNAFWIISIRLPIPEIWPFKEKANYSIVYLNTWLNSIKIRKTLNRYNSEDNYFRSMSERSLEARNLALWNAFLVISIRLPVAEISSCKGKGNF